MSCSFNLLEEEVFSVRSDVFEGVKKVSLPALFELLSKGSKLEMSKLATHHQAPFHMFCCQLAAITIEKQGWSTIAQDEESWRRAFLEATEGRREPWCLVVEDLSQPAFLQSAIPEGSFAEAEYNTFSDYPDDIDIFYTGKNHTLKRERLSSSSIEHWVATLLSLQTMAPYNAGQRRVSRMSSGYSSRCYSGVYSALDPSTRFLEDVERMIRQYEQPDFLYKGLPSLLWDCSWNGSSERYNLWEIHPYYIEISRRVRMFCTKGDDQIRCRKRGKGTSKELIKLPEGNSGVSPGCPWSVVEIAKDSFGPLNIGERGFHYAKLSQILIGEKGYRLPVCYDALDSSCENYWFGQVLSGGESVTKGFHQRTVPFPSGQRLPSFLDDFPDEEEEVPSLLGSRCELMLEHIDIVGNKVLRRALTRLQKHRGSEYSVSFWESQFDRYVDRNFFVYLFFKGASFDSLERFAHLWSGQLYLWAKEVFEQALREVVMPSAKRLEQQAEAQNIFQALLKKYEVNTTFRKVDLDV